MRTNIVIDDALMRQAMQASGARTKREAVEVGLLTLVRMQQQGDIRAYRGGLPLEDDLEDQRLDADSEPNRPGAVVIVVDSSAWIDFFNGVKTPQVERLDGLLGVTPIAIGALILVDVVQGFRQEKDGATARQLFSSLVPLHGAAVDAQNAQCLEGSRELPGTAPPRHHGAQDHRWDHCHSLQLLRRSLRATRQTCHCYSATWT